MTYKSLFKLAIQLTGLYFIFVSIVELPKAIGYVLLFQGRLPYGSGTLFYQLASIIVIAILGLVVIRTASKISDLFVPADEPALLNIKKEKIIEIVIVTSGIFMIVARIPDIYPALVSLMGGSDNFSLFINTLVTIIACVILVWKAQVISQFLVKKSSFQSQL